VHRSARTLILRTLIPAVLFISIAITLASAAQAQNKADEKPSAAATAQARKAYKKGQQYFDAGEYQNAEAAFRKAYAAVPNPVVLLSVGECQKRTGKYAEAVSTFERYLKGKLDAKERAEVENKIEEIKSMPATLAVTTDPQGAKISIDGSDSGKVSPAEVEMAPGEHTVELSLETGETVTKTVQADFGARHELIVEIGAESLFDPFHTGSDGASVYNAEPEAKEDENTARSSVAPWIVMSVGGAALLVGTVLGAMALSEESDFDENPTTDSADTGERLALFADVAFGVGAVTVVTGLVLLLTEEDPERDETGAAAKGSGPRVLAAPVLLRDGGGMAASVRF
jgi:hypothetical protein